MLVHPTHVFDGLIVNPEAHNASNTFLIYYIMFCPCFAEDENIIEI